MKEYKYFIDTNIFLRYLLGDNPKQAEECRLFLELVINNRIDAYTSDLVINEIAWTLKSVYKVDKDNIVKAINLILNTPGIKVVNDSDTYIAVSLYSNTNTKLVDCFIASQPKVQKKEWIIVSFDKDFDKLRSIRQEPLEVYKKNKPRKIEDVIGILSKPPRSSKGKIFAQIRKEAYKNLRKI